MSSLQDTSEFWRHNPQSILHCDHNECLVAATYTTKSPTIILCTQHFESEIVGYYVRRYMAENHAVLVTEPEPHRRFSCESWWLWPTQEGTHHCKDYATMRFEASGHPEYWFCTYHAGRIQRLFDSYVFQQLEEITDPVFVLANNMFKHLEVAFA